MDGAITFLSTAVSAKATALPNFFLLSLMRNLKGFGAFLSFILFFLPPHLYAQQARYSAVAVGETVKIAGKWGNAIHAWSMPVQFPLDPIYKPTIVTLHIFSDEMKLLNERKILLGKTLLIKLDFQLADSFYYARIVYGFPSPKKMVLKIDQSGNTEDLTSIPGTWTSNAAPEDVQHLGQVTRNETSLFAIKAETVIANNTPDTSHAAITINNETASDGSLQQIIIKKASRKTGKIIATRVFAAGQLYFSALLVSATDSSVTASGFVKSGINAGRQNDGKSDYLFLARMDTSLAGQTHALLKVSPGSRNETYSLKNIYNVSKRLLLISAGQRSQTSFTYGIADKNSIPTVPQEHSYYLATSLRISVLDEKNNFLLDTILKSTSDIENLPPENIFITVSDSAADIFCLHDYSRYKKGITHFSIEKSGNITEREMIVNENYTYRLGSSEQLSPGILLIPYRHKKQNGLMRLAYEPAQ